MKGTSDEAGKPAPADNQTENASAIAAHTPYEVAADADIRQTPLAATKALTP
jgi:hypothetical protein